MLWILQPSHHDAVGIGIAAIVEMARPLRLHVPGALYHVMSRGNAKQSIFLRDEDYRQFLDLLTVTTARFDIVCRAYCLMPNHFHLLLEPSAHPLSRMMQQLNSAYSQWFNRRHQRVGHVLQGRFKALLVDRNEYFLQVLRYILLNPVRAGLAGSAQEWHWSSYNVTAGAGAERSFLALEDVWLAFDADADRARSLFVEFVAAGVERAEPQGPVALGSASFRDGISALLEPHRQAREISKGERFAMRPSLEQLFAGPQDGSCRDSLMSEAFRSHGYTLREIAQLFDIHPSTVFKHIRRSESGSKPAPTVSAGSRSRRAAKIKI